MEHSHEGWWLPSLKAEPEINSESLARRSWIGSTKKSAMPTNSSFMGGGLESRATWRSTIYAVLHKP
jgi:hypothetical protein